MKGVAVALEDVDESFATDDVDPPPGRVIKQIVGVTDSFC